MSDLSNLSTEELAEVAVFSHAQDPGVTILPPDVEDTDAPHGVNDPAEIDGAGE